MGNGVDIWDAAKLSSCRLMGSFYGLRDRLDEKMLEIAQKSLSAQRFRLGIIRGFESPDPATFAQTPDQDPVCAINKALEYLDQLKKTDEAFRGCLKGADEKFTKQHRKSISFIEELSEGLQDKAKSELDDHSRDVAGKKIKKDSLEAIFEEHLISVEAPGRLLEALFNENIFNDLFEFLGSIEAIEASVSSDSNTPRSDISTSSHSESPRSSSRVSLSSALKDGMKIIKRIRKSSSTEEKYITPYGAATVVLNRHSGDYGRIIAYKFFKESFMKENREGLSNITEFITIILKSYNDTFAEGERIVIPDNISFNVSRICGLLVQIEGQIPPDTYIDFKNAFETFRSKILFRVEE